MAYRASPFFKGNARQPSPNSMHAGASTVVSFTHVFDKDDLQPADVLELFALPAGARVVDFTYTTENLPAGNGTYGIMSGEPGNPDGARTVGTEFVNAVAHPAVNTSVLLATLMGVAKSDSNRSVGFKTSAAIAVAANRKIHGRVTLQF